MISLLKYLGHQVGSAIANDSKKTVSDFVDRNDLHLQKRLTWFSQKLFFALSQKVTR
jgi:hypothetical protein